MLKKIINKLVLKIFHFIQKLRCFGSERKRKIFKFIFRNIKKEYHAEKKIIL
jgi:hypothetical protein